MMAEDPHCRYCRCRLNERDNDDRQATIDHIIPSSLGGSDLWDNLQLLCRQCNGEKGATVGRSRNVIAQAHSLRGPAGSGYHRLADGLSAREEIEEQLEEVMPVSPSVAARRPIDPIYIIIDAKLAKPWTPEELLGGRYLDFLLADLTFAEAEEVAEAYRKEGWTVSVVRLAPPFETALSIVFTPPKE